MSHEAACDVVLTREQLHYLGAVRVGRSRRPARLSRGARRRRTLPPPALDDLVARAGCWARRASSPGSCGPSSGCTGRRRSAASPCAVTRSRPRASASSAGADSVALVNVAPGLRVVSPAAGGRARGPPRRSCSARAPGATRRSTWRSACRSRASSPRPSTSCGESRSGTSSTGRRSPSARPALAAWILRDDPSAQWLSGHLAPLLARRGGTFEPAQRAAARRAARGAGPARRGRRRPGGRARRSRRSCAGWRCSTASLELRAGRATGGASPVAADIVVVKADSGALLLWEAEPDGSLRWVTPSADEAKETAMRLLTRADALARRPLREDRPWTSSSASSRSRPPRSSWPPPP